jgi:integrase
MRRSAGIFQDGQKWKVDKIVGGRRIRATFNNLADSELFVVRQITNARRGRLLGERPSISFQDAGLRYIEEKIDAKKPSATTDIHLFKMMCRVSPFDISISDISDRSFDGWRQYKKRSGERASSKTIHAGLSLAQSILRAAHERWTVPGTNITLMDVMPRLTLPSIDNQREPKSITWMEQERLLANLPSHLRAMSQFAINTGVRENVVVNIRWNWIIPVEDLQTEVIFVPRTFVKGRKEDQLIILNSTARRIIELQRGLHPEFVFVWRRERVVKPALAPVRHYQPVNLMNNTAWQSGRTRAGLGDLHVHDLRHTFATRLRSAGVGEQTVSDLLWHSKRTMTQHYMRADLRELLDAVERIAKPNLAQAISVDELRRSGRAQLQNRNDQHARLNKGNAR